MPLHNLVCPYCFLRCKSQHSHTHHIHTAHFNTLANANTCNHQEQNNGPPNIEVVPLANGPGAVGQRKEHPHLTGMCVHHFEVLTAEFLNPLCSPSMQLQWQLLVAWFPATIPRRLVQGGLDAIQR
jgi:hypothetical protein